MQSFVPLERRIEYSRIFRKRISDKVWWELVTRINNPLVRTFRQVEVYLNSVLPRWIAVYIRALTLAPVQSKLAQAAPRQRRSPGMLPVWRLVSKLHEELERHFGRYAVIIVD